MFLLNSIAFHTRKYSTHWKGQEGIIIPVTWTFLSTLLYSPQSLKSLGGKKEKKLGKGFDISELVSLSTQRMKWKFFKHIRSIFVWLPPYFKLWLSIVLVGHSDLGRSVVTGLFTRRELSIVVESMVLQCCLAPNLILPGFVWL